MKTWKLNFYATNTLWDEFTREIVAETKEDAIKKLKENFYGYDLKDIYLIGVKDKEVA